MPSQPIGISFIPSVENQAQGPQQNAMEGGGSDLTQAWKVLSLQLPRVMGAQSLAPKRLLNGAGAAGVAGGLDPHAAAFQALIQAMVGASGGNGYMPTDQRQPTGTPTAPAGNPYTDFFANEPRMPQPRTDPGLSVPPRLSPPDTRVIPGDDSRAPTLPNYPMGTAPTLPSFGQGPRERNKVV